MADASTTSKELRPGRLGSKAMLGGRIGDYTAEEAERIAHVFAAAVSEAGWPTVPERHGSERQWCFPGAQEVPIKVAERAMAIAHQSIGREWEGRIQ
jgi:hypothetical protein